jgi:hypothetical protein
MARGDRGEGPRVVVEPGQIVETGRLDYMVSCVSIVAKTKGLVYDKRNSRGCCGNQ